MAKSVAHHQWNRVLLTFLAVQLGFHGKKGYLVNFADCRESFAG